VLVREALAAENIAGGFSAVRRAKAMEAGRVSRIAARLGPLQFAPGADETLRRL
jgi:hypothetical protein